MRKQKENKAPPGSSGITGTWDPTGTAMFLDGRKYVVDKQLRTVSLPLSDKDKEYLKTIHSPEVGSGG